MSDQIVIISESKKEGQHGHSIHVSAFPEAEGVYLVVGPFDDETERVKGQEDHAVAGLTTWVYATELPIRTDPAPDLGTHATRELDLSKFLTGGRVRGYAARAV